MSFWLQKNRSLVKTLLFQEQFWLANQLYRGIKFSFGSGRTFYRDMVRFNHNVYVNSFFSYTSHLCNSPRISCFPLNFDLKNFKCNDNYYLLFSWLLIFRSCNLVMFLFLNSSIASKTLRLSGFTPLLGV